MKTSCATCKRAAQCEIRAALAPFWDWRKLDPSAVSQLNYALCRACGRHHS